MSQKQSPIKSVFYNIVKYDFEMIGECLYEAETIAFSVDSYMKRIINTVPTVRKILVCSSSSFA